MHTRLLSIGILLTCLGTAMAQISNAKPKADDPAAHAFPALGSSYERKVEVAWNQYYDCAGLGSILARLNKAFPKLTKLYSIGKSHRPRRGITAYRSTRRILISPSSLKRGLLARCPTSSPPLRLC